jgi:hypothetical protein
MTRHQPRAGPSMAIHSSGSKGIFFFFLSFLFIFYFRDVVVSDLDNAPPSPLLPLQTFFVWDLHLHGDADIIIQFCVCLCVSPGHGM